MGTPAENLRHGWARRDGRPLPGPPAGHPVRIIEYDVTIDSRDGPCATEAFRLVTTLLDHEQRPARPAGRALSPALGDRAGLRRAEDPTPRRRRSSCAPAPRSWSARRSSPSSSSTRRCARLRMRAAQAADTDPDRISFTVTLRLARDQVLQPGRRQPRRPPRRGRADHRPTCSTNPAPRGAPAATSARRDRSRTPSRSASSASPGHPAGSATRSPSPATTPTWANRLSNRHCTTVDSCSSAARNPLRRGRWRAGRSSDPRRAAGPAARGGMRCAPARAAPAACTRRRTSGRRTSRAHRRGTGARRPAGPRSSWSCSAVGRSNWLGERDPGTGQAGCTGADVVGEHGRRAADGDRCAVQADLAGACGQPWTGPEHAGGEVQDRLLAGGAARLVEGDPGERVGQVTGPCGQRTPLDRAGGGDGRMGGSGANSGGGLRKRRRHARNGAGHDWEAPWTSLGRGRRATSKSPGGPRQSARRRRSGSGAGGIRLRVRCCVAVHRNRRRPGSARRRTGDDHPGTTEREHQQQRRR